MLSSLVCLSRGFVERVRIKQQKEQVNLEGQRERMSKKYERQMEKNELNEIEKLKRIGAVDIGAKRGESIKAGYIGIEFHLV